MSTTNSKKLKPSSSAPPLSANGNTSSSGKKSGVSNKPNLYPLVHNEMEVLQFEGPLQYPNLVRIRTPMDTSSLLHSLVKATYIPYRTGKRGNDTVNKYQIIRDLRNELATKLASRVNPEDPHSPIYYDTLAYGRFRELAKTNPEFGLEYMQKELLSDISLRPIYYEFLARILNIDIYVLDLEKEDVYPVEYEDILYENRDSVVVGFLMSNKNEIPHYELIGISNNNNNTIKTKFRADSKFITTIRDRMNNLANKPEETN